MFLGQCVLLWFQVWGAGVWERESVVPIYCEGEEREEEGGEERREGGEGRKRGDRREGRREEGRAVSVSFDDPTFTPINCEGGES